MTSETAKRAPHSIVSGRLDNLGFTISNLAARSNASVISSWQPETRAPSALRNRGWTRRGFVHGINRSAVNNSRCSVYELLESAFTSSVTFIQRDSLRAESEGLVRLSSGHKVAKARCANESTHIPLYPLRLFYPRAVSRAFPVTFIAALLRKTAATSYPPSRRLSLYHCIRARA